MLNHIWAFLIIVGILTGLTSAVYRAETGETVTTKVDGKEVTEIKTYDTTAKKLQAFSDSGNKLTTEVFNRVSFRYSDSSGKERSGAVGLAINYIGMMALWLGIMKIAEVAGLIQILSRAIAPLFRILFPRVPSEHPASGAILMNFAANMLGLDNAATPLGIKAMKELQELNGRKDTASNAMVMFLCINVSSITLLPASVIGFRASLGSKNPAGFLVAMWIATFIGTLSAIILCKMWERFSPDTPLASEVADGDIAESETERA